MAAASAMSEVSEERAIGDLIVGSFGGNEKSGKEEQPCDFDRSKRTPSALSKINNILTYCPIYEP
jgi:hypothetical protein